MDRTSKIESFNFASSYQPWDVKLTWVPTHRVQVFASRLWLCFHSFLGRMRWQSSQLHILPRCSKTTTPNQLSFWISQCSWKTGAIVVNSFDPATSWFWPRIRYKKSTMSWTEIAENRREQIDVDFLGTISQKQWLAYMLQQLIQKIYKVCNITNRIYHSMAFQDFLKATFPPMILAQRCWELQQQSCWLASFGGMLGQPRCWGSRLFGFMILKLTGWICRETRVHKALKAVGFEYLLVSQIQVDGNKICLESRSATRLCFMPRPRIWISISRRKRQHGSRKIPLVCCLFDGKIGIPWCSFACGEKMGV